jgi:hypothetical protein
MFLSDFATFRRRAWHRRRAHSSYRLGQDLADYYRNRNSARGARMAAQCYRHALRLLGEAPEVMGARPSAEAVRQRLADTTIRAALWRERRRIALVGGAMLVLAGLAVAFLPPLRAAVFPVDLAAGRPWVATSAWPGFTATGIMKDATKTEGLFHTIEEQSAAVTVDLGAIKRVHAIEIENRRDDFRLRALPLAVEVSTDNATWMRVGYRRADFKQWTAKFPKMPVRYVRARVDRVSYLHLRRIRVY